MEFLDFSDLELHMEQIQGLVMVLCESRICNECETMKYWRGSLCILESRITEALSEVERLDKQNTLLYRK